MAAPVGAACPANAIMGNNRVPHFDFRALKRSAMGQQTEWLAVRHRFPRHSPQLPLMLELTRRQEAPREV